MTTIEQLREQIDKIDADIIKKLSSRKTLSIQIGRLKAKMDKVVLDSSRENKLFQLYEKLCKEYDLDPVFIKKLFELIISNSRDVQK